MWIHYTSRKRWLGSSPNGVVLDTADESIVGLLELKCPYTKRGILPKEPCRYPNFCCSLSDDGSIILKRTHAYYHQIQLQLYVLSDMYKWCDFCVYTMKGILIEQIYFDSEWIESSILELSDYFENHNYVA